MLFFAHLNCKLQFIAWCSKRCSKRYLCKNHIEISLMFLFICMISLDQYIIVFYIFNYSGCPYLLWLSWQIIVIFICNIVFAIYRVPNPYDLAVVNTFFHEFQPLRPVYQLLLIMYYLSYIMYLFALYYVKHRDTTAYYS